MMCEVGPRAEIIHKQYPKHIYSNESERTNQDISDDFKLKKNPLHDLYTAILAVYG